MDLKLVEDLIALQRCASFVRAAEERHVTHPAFGRRIRALEGWAGVPLVERGAGTVRLTAAGSALLAQAEPLLDALLRQRQSWQLRAAPGEAPRSVLRLATGRTLARTLVADWLARLKVPLRGHFVELHTRSMQEVARLLHAGEVDMLCCYEHPALSIALNAQRFRHLTLAHDRLVPVARGDAAGKPRLKLGTAPLIGYAATLSLGRLLDDHLARSGDRLGVALQPAFVCDSADAIHALALKGLGVAWLPWSLVAADCRRGLLAPLGGRADEVHFDVRLYRPRSRQNAAVEAAWAASAR